MTDFGLDYVRPYLYPKQMAAIYEPRRMSLIEASTKAGKTSGCVTWIIEKALGGEAGQNYWWVAPVSDQALIAFRRAMRALPQDVYTPNISLKTITLINGTVIWFKSGDKPNSLYGEDVYAVVIDEASRMKEDAYIAIRSTVTFTRAQLRIIGNVRGRKNWFFKLARRAEHGDPEMAYHKIVANDAVAAGVLDAKEIEDARTQMPEQSWRELYLAEPSDDGGNPFGLQHIQACIVPEVSKLPARWWGWDLAKRQDYTVGIGLDINGRVARFERLQNTPWDRIIEHIIIVTNGVPALVDSTGLGDPIVDMLQKQGGPHFEGYHFNQTSKQKLMEGLAVAIQSHTIGFPEGIIVQELEQYEYEFTRTGVRYCVAPATKILTADLRHVDASSLKIGDGLLAFDEYPVSGKTRKWRPAIVTATAEIMRPCYRIRLADGTVIEASQEHLWLVDMGRTPEWRRTDQLRGLHQWSRSHRFAPTRLMRLVDTWSDDVSREAGYLAAAFDGEGWLAQSAKSHGGHSSRLGMAQRENEMLAHVRECLHRLGFSWADYRGQRGVKSLAITGTRPEFLRFLGQVRPQRLLPKFDPMKLGTLACKSLVPIISVEAIGVCPVIALGTSTATLVAEGFASHNSAPSGYNDDAVCALALAQMHRSITPLPLNITPKTISAVVASGRYRRRIA